MNMSLSAAMREILEHNPDSSADGSDFWNINAVRHWYNPIQR
jgi:hypothetical protein